uniref:Uncharacterized protein n=1 Tax=Rhizophora mucronata TaxID=61149 RepID=A0A2P2Q118_RHIMU
MTKFIDNMYVYTIRTLQSTTDLQELKKP